MLSDPYYNYYEKDGIKYSSKLEAITGYPFSEDETSISILSNIKWHLPNIEKNVLKLDPLVEPSKSLNQFYLERAISLRNKYDYLILYYSGGMDSHQVLETFMLNNIYLDEIVIIDWMEANSAINDAIENKLSPYYQYGNEIRDIAIPTAKFFIETYSPKTKLNIVIDGKKSAIKYFANLTDHKYKWLAYTDLSRLLSYSQIWSRDSSVLLLGDRYKELASSKKVAHILGHDKPHIRKDTKGIYLSISSYCANMRYDPYYSLDESGLPFVAEYFYIHPDFMDMWIKGGHVLMNYFKNNHYLLDDSNFIKKVRGRKFENEQAKALYTFKHFLNYWHVKDSDIIHSKIGDKLFEFYTRDGKFIDSAASPFVIKLFTLSNTSIINKNYNSFVLFLQKNYFPSYTIHNMMKLLTTSFSFRTYIKYF